MFSQNTSVQGQASVRNDGLQNVLATPARPPSLTELTGDLGQRVTELVAANERLTGLESRLIGPASGGVGLGPEEPAPDSVQGEIGYQIDRLQRQLPCLHDIVDRLDSGIGN